MTAGVEDIVVLGERPMPIARDKPGQLDRGPERDRRLAAQGGEGATRTSSSSAQKSREPSSISAIGTSGGGVPFTRVAIAVLRPIEILLPPSPLKG